MIIKIERSGGIAGISKSIEMDSKDLPSALVARVEKIIQDKKSAPILSKVTPRGAADHYTYKVSMSDGENQRIIDFNQYNLQDEIRLLLKYFEKYSKKR